MAESRPRRSISSTREAALAERAAFTDGQILDAAELLFARHGLRGTRVREIAGAAGLNEATLYNYYKNKEALYEAVLDRGIQFESTVGKQPFTFILCTGQVIPGWDQGLQGMKAGGKRTLIIPSGLAYGAQGAEGTIPPNSALKFEVELLEVK